MDKLGPGLNLLGRMVLGKRVTVINGAGGNWAEYAVIPARQARPVASDIPDEQVASFFVNPATVLAMVRKVLKVPKGAWLLQSAAGSELGKMIIRLGRHDGFKTLNVVRRSEARAELQELGAERYLLGRGADRRPGEVSGGTGRRPYALDPVGGETGTQVFRSLAPNGRMLLYGSFSGEPVSIESRLMIAGDRTLSGFWLGHWMRQQNVISLPRPFPPDYPSDADGCFDFGDWGRNSGSTRCRRRWNRPEAVGRKGKTLLKIG